jgi:hypothetical protein
MLMHKFLCCSLLVFAFELQAKESVNETSPKDDSPAVFSTKFNSSVKDYAGLTVGVGVNIGVHETKVKANKEFDAPTRVKATTFGGTIAVGFQKAICGNCFVGFEVGADIGGTGKRARIGGNIGDNSAMMLAYRDDYSRKEGILRQMFDNIGDDAFDTRDIDNELQYVLSERVYGRFILSMRCLGGTSNFTSANNNSFMTADAHNNGIWYNTDGIYQANPDAVFANFIGGMSMINIRALGNGNFQSGYEIMKEFTRENFPIIYDALGHMAEQQIAVMGNGAVLGPSVNQDGTVNADGVGAIDEQNDILWEIPHQLSIFFNDEYIRRYENIGVNPVGRDINALRREIEALYNPDNSHIQPQLNPAEIRALNDFKSKTSFGICPYAAIKVGYFCKEIQGCVYAKVGIMQLQGHITAINDFLKKKDNFQKFSPLFAFGISKTIKDRYGISLELSHALKTNKKMREISWKGYKVNNDVTVSKTDLRVLVTYTF